MKFLRTVLFDIVTIKCIKVSPLWLSKRIHCGLPTVLIKNQRVALVYNKET